MKQFLFWQLPLLFVAILSVSHSSAYRILGLFPHPAISHYRVFEPILHGLAKAGHNVTVFSHFPSKNIQPNFTDILMPGVVLTAGIDFSVSPSESQLGRNKSLFRKKNSLLRRSKLLEYL